KSFIKPLIALVFFSALIDVSASKLIVPMPKNAAIEKVQTRAPSPIAPTFTPESPKRTTLIFTGDINLGRCVAGTSIRAGDYDYPFRFVADKLGSADITIGSL